MAPSPGKPTWKPASPSNPTRRRNNPSVTMLTRLAPSVDAYAEHVSIFDGDVEARKLLARRTAAGYEHHVHKDSTRAERAARAHNARTRAGKFGRGKGSRQRASTSDEPEPAERTKKERAGGLMKARMARSQRQEEKKRADARERSRLNAANRILAQRAARVGRYGAHEESTLGRAVGVERRLKTHGHTTGKLESFEREGVAREVEVEAEQAMPPPLLEYLRQSKKTKNKKTTTITLQPKASITWMSAAETRWPPHPSLTPAAPTATCERDKNHLRRRSPSPTSAELRKRQAAHIAPSPLRSTSTTTAMRHQQQQGGDAHHAGREHASPAPPPDLASPASLSAIEAHRVRELVAHSRSSSSVPHLCRTPAPTPPSVMPPFTLASLRLLEVAHPALKARHAVLQRVTPGAVLRQWAAYLAVADEDDDLHPGGLAKENVGDGDGGGGEAARRRLARRMGGMLVAFGAWAAADAASGAGTSATEAEAEGTHEFHTAKRVLAELSADAEKHPAWMKTAVSEWRSYRASWFAGSATRRT